MKGLISVLPFDIAPDSIPLSMPTLLAQLEKANIKSKGIDFNAELYNEILTPKYLKNSYKKIENLYKQICANNDNTQKSQHKRKIYETIIKNKQLVYFLIKSLPNIKKEFHNKNITLGIRIPKQMMKILKVAFAPYSELAPWRSFSYSYNYNDIKNFSKDKDNNIFYDFLQKYGHRYNFKKYDFVGISAPLENSLYYAFTLGYYIKMTAPNTKVVMGGAIITRLWDDITQYPEIFDIFCDNLLVGDGDFSIEKYVQYIENKIPPEEVPGLVYRNTDNKLISIPSKNVDINEIAFPSYKNIDLNKYPKNILLNIQLSRGCPWGRCSFCTFSYPYRQKYSILSVKKAVDMIEDIVKKYNIRDYYIVDESIPYKFFIEFAKELIKRNINIKYDCRLRFDECFNNDIFKLLSKSGLRSIFWGYEAESERVLTMMNKGIIPNNRAEILKKAKEAGIINKLGFIFGFPGETEEEINQTINFITQNNKKLFDRFSISIFSLEKNSFIIKDPEKFNIKDITKKSDFGVGYNYSQDGISREKVSKLIKHCMNLVNVDSNDIINE